MTDMSKFSGKKEFPSQTKNRERWILDTVRANQLEVRSMLQCFEIDEPRAARVILMEMHKGDRDALLQPNGILTDEQIELLK